MKHQLQSSLLVLFLISTCLTFGCSTKTETKKKRPPLIKRKTSKVVNMQKAIAENPKLFPVENKLKYKDPISGPLSAYVSLSSKVNVIAFQHNLNLLRAMKERGEKLTYEEVVQSIKETKMEFNALPDNQTYAYDEKTGQFLILEDPDIKNSFHGEPIEEN